MNFDIPINNLSLGQVSVNILKEAHKRGTTSCVFQRGAIDFSCFGNSLPDDFHVWMQKCLKAGSSFNREEPVLKLWHINGLLESYSNNNFAYTFHETSQITEFEYNTLKQQKKVFVSSKYTQKVFEDSGLKNIVYAPLGFDSDSFHRIEDESKSEIISFSLGGKLEKRKHTLKIMKCWAKEFGNNEKYRLNCSIHNPFIGDEALENIVRSEFEGKVPWNINFLPHFPLNEEYNKILNASDIDLTGLSGCEGFNLPLFQSLCIGKQAVVLNAHVHKDFCNEYNSILIEPKGTLRADDGVFFREGLDFNQGDWFDFDEDDALSAMKEAEKVAKVRNVAGEKLKEQFTYSNMLDIIKNEMEAV